MSCTGAVALDRDRAARRRRRDRGDADHRARRDPRRRPRHRGRDGGPQGCRVLLTARPQRQRPPPAAVGPHAPGDGRLGRRRQVDADRPAAARRQGDPRRPARRPPAARDGALDLSLPHRRPARRARAGHHDRRRLPLLRDGAALVHPRRHARPRAVHAQHGHGRLDRRPRDRARRRAQRRGRADQAPRVHRGAARHPAHRRSPSTRWTSSTTTSRSSTGSSPTSARSPAPRRARRRVHPDERAGGRQRRRPLRGDGLVRGAAAARAPRDGADRGRPQPRRAALPGPVRDPRPRDATTAATRGGSPAASSGRATRCSSCRAGRRRRSRRSTPSTARSTRPSRR